MKITVILTCYNRKEKTLAAIKSLSSGNPNQNLRFIVVDDNSSDGTVEDVMALGLNIEIIRGTGDLFWSGGMRKGIGCFLDNPEGSDYMLLINDDVEFYSDILTGMIERSIVNNDAIVVGATCDGNGDFSYGALTIINNRGNNSFGVPQKPSSENISCDTFNCNCVLVKTDVAQKLGNFDAMYKHSLADWDYGLSASRSGIKILSTENYIGVCNKNSIKGTWRDRSLSRIERIRAKESVKGAPTKQWFYYLKKNFGMRTAIIYSITPYIRILIRK